MSCCCPSGSDGPRIVNRPCVRRAVPCHDAPRVAVDLTYDGVDVCGDRLAQYVKEACSRLADAATPVTKISFIGYSLGGMMCRCGGGEWGGDGNGAVMHVCAGLLPATLMWVWVDR